MKITKARKGQTCEARVLQPPHYIRRETCGKNASSVLDELPLCGTHAAQATDLPPLVGVWWLWR